MSNLPYRKGQLIELAIADAAEGATCFGRMDGGLAVFVHGQAAVGDTVQAEVTRIKKNLLEARLVRVVAPSPDRIEPVCPHFGACGGCKWQHIRYDAQLRIKRKLVTDALEHIGGFAGVDVREPLPSPLTFGYRNKIDFSFGDRRFLTAAEMGIEAAALTKPMDFALGFHAAGVFSKVLDIDRCHIATDEMNAALEVVKRFARARKLRPYSSHTHEGFLRNLVIRKAFSGGGCMVHLITSTHDPALMGELLRELLAALGEGLTTFINGVTQRLNTVAYADETHVIHGPGHLVEELGGLRFKISPNSFFQTNTPQAERLYQTALDFAGLMPGDVAHDLFCGTGTIALYLARACRRVYGFELEESAVRDARANAELNGVTNCEFRHVDMKHLGATLADLGPEAKADVVVTDPPRAGMHEKAVETLRALPPRRIVYVSCNPASLARDAKLLCEGGLYKLGPIQPVDLFPHTYHIESVAILDRA